MPKDELSDSLRESVRHLVQESLPGLVVRITEVQEIQRTARGKYLELISELD